MQPEGLFAGIRQFSPNAMLNVAGNELEITIPFDDIINAIKSSFPENMRHLVNVTVVNNGVKIKARLF